MSSYNIAIIGLGTVGGGVYKNLKSKGKLLAKRAGVPIKLKAVNNRSNKKYKALNIPKSLIQNDLKKILKDPEIHCVVELVGGKKAAKSLILDAFKNGKDVVTANKALLAEDGDEIFKAAKKYGRQIYFEASVGGGIPIIKAVRESLSGNRISSILSIINGTANYVLTRMTQDGMAFKAALKIAQEKGYAEADPTFDVEGIDAAHKIKILGSLAFEKNIQFQDVSCTGISRIEPLDIEFAKEVGYVIKLLAIAKQTKEGIEARVQPTLLPKDHLLASINGSYNAVHLQGDDIGNMVFVGKGAGSKPTASAVVSDIVDLARIASGLSDKMPYPIYPKIKAKNLLKVHSRYYLRFSVVDRPGVLSHISNILGKLKISISDVVQRERVEGSIVPLIVFTHDTSEREILEAIRKIDKLPEIKRKSQVIRIEA